MLTELRDTVTDALTAADIRAFGYVGEAITPPCAVVVPAEPYFQTAADAPEPTPPRKVWVGIDVLLLVPRGEAKTEAAAIDGLIESAYQALNPIRAITIGTVRRPGVVTLKDGSKFVGSAVSIKALSEEP